MESCELISNGEKNRRSQFEILFLKQEGAVWILELRFNKFFYGCFGSMPAAQNNCAAQSLTLRETTTNNDHFPETNAKMTVSNMSLPGLHS